MKIRNTTSPSIRDVWGILLLYALIMAALFWIDSIK